jgi:hypothetical protein
MMNETKYTHNSKWFPIVIFIIFFLFIQIFDIINWELQSFIIKNIFLIVLLYYNIKNYKKSNPHNWLLNPAVLASIMTFLLGYCITNYVYFVPGSDDENQMVKLLGSEPLIYFNKGLNAVIISAISMWLGYNTKIGNKLYKLILHFPINFKKYFRSSFIPNLKIIYLIFILAIASRIYAIYLGIFGYSQSPENLKESISIAYILLSITDLSTLSLVVISFAYFKNPINTRYKYLFILVLSIEIIFGILSGMKSAVVMPLILSFITYYLVNNKFHKGFIIGGIVFITIAYVIIEPFRILKSNDPNFKSTPTNIINTMVDAYILNKSIKIVPGSESIFESIASRNAFLLPASRSIQYSDKIGLNSKDPDFFEKIYTIPIQTFIPRIIWSDKPVEDYGKWYSVNVFGSVETSSVAMTPMGFLYFAGGYAFIVLGFFLIGVMQKTLWQFYLAGGGQLLIFLALLNTVVLIDSAYNGMVVYWLRFLPVFIFLQYFILKKDKKSNSSTN